MTMRALSIALSLTVLSAPVSAQEDEEQDEEREEVVTAGWAGRLVGPRARDALRNPEAEVRIHAVRTLARAGEHQRAVTALLDALEAEEDPRVRPEIFTALARRGDPIAVPRLVRRLGELGRDDRAMALRTIGAIGGEPGMRALVEWLGAIDVGEDAVAALVSIGAPAVPHLLRALRAPAALPRAATALGRIGDARATPALAAAFASALPPARVAILEALGALADERAAPTLVRALEDPSDEVVLAALDAIATAGGPELGAAVAAHVGPDRPPMRRAHAVGALVRIDPALAAPRVRAILADEQTSPLVRRAAMDGVLALPAPELVPALSELAADPEHRGVAADALARAPDGAGLAALVALAEDEAMRVPLALALRRSRADGPAAADAQRILAADRSARGAIVSALALDAGALPRLVTLLDSERATDRTLAAIGIALLGQRAASIGARVLDALARERDDAAFRALALAASALDLGIDPDRVAGRFEHSEIAPEALWVAAPNLRDAAPGSRRRARRAMRAGLRSYDPRLRAGAALALARAADRASWRAVAALLDDEHDAVRLAAARALASLSVPASESVLSASSRIERAPDVRRALRAALEGADGRAPPAAVHGTEVLFVRVVAAPGSRREDDAPLSVDVVLPDGRWLRVSTLEGGEVLVPDLPSGEAEVIVRP